MLHKLCVTMKILYSRGEGGGVSGLTVGLHTYIHTIMKKKMFSKLDLKAVFFLIIIIYLFLSYNEVIFLAHLSRRLQGSL